MPVSPATRGSTKVGLEAEGARGRQGPGPLLWFSWEEMGDAGLVC